MGRIAMALTAAVAVVGAHQAPQVFRGGVELVHFDVSVLDNQRRPVRGLTAEAFTLLEDGKPQKIETFAAVEIPIAFAPGAS